jgi:hypothetical protein
MNDALLRLALILIAAITVLSGLGQMVMGGTILPIIAASATPAEVHLFGTIGMFMVITGAMFLQSLLARSTETSIPLWIGVQKVAAAVLVTIAVAKGYFLWLALGVAAFDAFSGALAFIFWRRMPR